MRACMGQGGGGAGQHEVRGRWDRDGGRGGQKRGALAKVQERRQCGTVGRGKGLGWLEGVIVPQHCGLPAFVTTADQRPRLQMLGS